MDHAMHHAAPGGTLIAENGYRLVLPATIVDAGRREVTFTIVDPAGVPVTAVVAQHEKDLHLIAVRRDLTGFQHVHPVRDEHGTWHVDLDLTPGAWRLIADAVPAAADGGLTLGADLLVAGAFDPAPVPRASTTTVVDGYTVTLDGELVVGGHQQLTFTVEVDGAPVVDLDPYLAAYGHLVALRVGDLAYLHVHPDGEPGDGLTVAGPQITFLAGAPAAGVYRLYLDFQHDAVVHTAEFTVVATESASADHPAHHHHH